MKLLKGGKMSYKDYTVTMPYNEFKKLQEIEEKYRRLKENLVSCFEPSTDTNILTVDVARIEKICIEFLPMRYQEYSFNEVK